MINTRKDLYECLYYEFNLYDDTYIKYLFHLGESSILRKHLVLLRKAEYFYNSNKKIRSVLYRILLSKFQNKYGIHIPLNTCDKGLKIMHVGPVLLNDNAVVGKDCSIHINSALVANGLSDRAPKVGNGVVIGIGAILIGDITIADNVAIGAGSIVTKSVHEENIAIAGNPARRVSNNGRLNWNK